MSRGLQGDPGGKVVQWSKKAIRDKMAGLFREQKLAKGQPSPIHGLKSLRTGAGYVSHKDYVRVRNGEMPGEPGRLDLLIGMSVRHLSPVRDLTT